MPRIACIYLVDFLYRKEAINFRTTDVEKKCTQ